MEAPPAYLVTLPLHYTAGEYRERLSEEIKD